MTDLIRQKHTFLYHGEEFFCGDLTVEDYLLISIDPASGFEKILLEYNGNLPKLNERQTKLFLKILFGNGNEETQENLMDKLTETQKKIAEHKKKQKDDKTAQDLEEMLQDFHIIEGQMMATLHQPLSEMRKWPYKYFMKQYNDLAYITGAKEYSKDRHSKAPDKKAFKKEFGNIYNK